MMTYISRDRIRDGNDRAVSVLALCIGSQPTTAVWYGAVRILSIVEAWGWGGG